MLKQIMMVLVMIGAGWANNAAAGSVVVGAGTDVSTLDADAIKRLFLGRESQLGGKPVTLVFQKGGPVRDKFDGDVLGKPGAQLTTYWSKLVFTGKAKAPDEQEGDAAVKAKVASTAGAIGYIDDASVDASVKKVFGF